MKQETLYKYTIKEIDNPYDPIVSFWVDSTGEIDIKSLPTDRDIALLLKTIKDRKEIRPDFSSITSTRIGG